MIEVGQMRVRRRDKRIWFLALAIFAGVFLFTFLVQGVEKMHGDVEAANLAAFDPGYIISDYQMGNYNSMSEAEIQKFLTSKNSCGNTDYQMYQNLVSWYPGYSWHFKDGHFVCLSEELFGDGMTIGSGETAAHIIWQAAQDYRINPQVIIVLLEKEQSLITDDYPNSIQYRSATGYGCPDTAPCASEYYGFKNQVRKAAAMFRTVLDGGWTNYPLGENYIQYNPSSDCGGTVVNVRSLATSALYRYTPYQPNAAALSAGAGYGDGCSAYGNRNFYIFFENWFGGITRSEEVAVEAKTKFERPIMDGVYQIYSKAYPEKVVDIRGGVRKDLSVAETLVFSRNYGGTDNQLFYIEYNEKTGYYNIRNPVSSLYMDVKGGSIVDSTPIIMFKKNDSCNQDWLIDKHEDGSVSIISRCSSKVLDATSAGKLEIFKSHGGDNQKWTLRAIQEERLSLLSSEKEYKFIINDGVFDISGGINDGIEFGYIVSFRDNDQDNQKFVLAYDQDLRDYKIKNIASGLLLTGGHQVSVAKENGACSQGWIIEHLGQNDFRLYNACNRMGTYLTEIKVGSCYAVGNSFSNGVALKIEESTNHEDVNIDVDGKDIEPGFYQIRTFDGRAIDISGGVYPGMMYGNLVAFNARSYDNLNQLFYVKYDDESEAYEIYNTTSGLYLDVARSGVENGTNVIGFMDNGGYCNQRWNIEKVNESGYIISSSCSGKVLSISGNRIGSAFSIGIFDYNKSNAQIWMLAGF